MEKELKLSTKKQIEHNKAKLLSGGALKSEMQYQKELTLSQELELYKEVYIGLEGIKKAHMKQYNELKSKERELCDELDEPTSDELNSKQN